MNDPDPILLAEPGAAVPPVRYLRLKAALLLLFTTLLVVGAALYVLYARGAFEPTQKLVLLADDSEGVVVGMDMTFSGFPIGRVRGVELGETGNVRITLDVAKKDAHWLRTSSVFTLERGLVGGTAIRAFTGILTAPPLPDGAERPVLRGDATAELPRVLASAREVLENVATITAQDAALRATLANLQAATDKLKGPHGALGAVFGNDADAQKLVAALDRTNALLAKADTQLFGPQGVMKEARTTVVELNHLLADARESLKKVDAVLVEAQGIGADVHGATGDLGGLRADVEANLRKIEGMIGELNRKWPFARETEVKLP
jgi:phospholipid/cholesterol/gamma-HCH transport system substrate-binding protein